MKTPLMKSRKISITSSFKIDQDRQLTDTIVQRSSEDMFKQLSNYVLTKSLKNKQHVML